MTELESQLVQQFYNWELRGRGWVRYPERVVLEPPFRPFRFRMARPRNPNAGEMPTLLSGLSKAVMRMFSNSRPLVLEDQAEKEPSPARPQDRGEVIEMVTSFPPDVPVTIPAFANLLSSLGTCRHPLALEYAASERRIVQQWAVDESDAGAVEAHCQAWFPRASLSRETGLVCNLFQDAPALEIIELGLDAEFLVPLTGFRTLDPDPMLPLLTVLGSLQEKESAFYQVLFSPTSSPWAPSMRAAVAGPDRKPVFVNAPELVEQVEAKTATPLFAVAIRLAVGAASGARARALLIQLVDAFRIFGAVETGNRLIALGAESTKDSPEPVEDLLQDMLGRTTRRSGMILNLQELVSLAHFPSSSVRLPKLVRQVHKTKAAPAHLQGGSFVLGENPHGGRVSAVGLSGEERVRHMHVLGAPGTGKSTLLLNGIVQDILAGEGVAVLDPHGDLIDKVIGYIPEWRIPDVIVFDPSDEEYPVGFNILSAHSDQERNLLASDLRALFQRQSTSWGDQMTTVLSNAILAFLESTEGGTLADLRRFLLEDKYRKEFLKTVQEPEVIYFWQRNFPQVSGKPQASIVTRLDAFLRPKAIRNMVCQKASRLKFADIMDSGKIFLAKLPQGLIGQQNAHLFGSLLVSKFQQTAIARQAISAEERRSFWLYIDEAHAFVTPSMADILAGSRKYRLGLILAHQELRQLANRDAEVGGAVVSNPAVRVCFRLGEEDARKLAEGFSFFDASDLVDLGIGQAICRVGRSDYDFNLRIRLQKEPDRDTAQRIGAAVRSHTRSNYARPRVQVIEEYQAANALHTEPEEQGREVSNPGEERS